jgi:hypothetical protein
MDRRLTWILSRGAFAAALALAVEFDLEWLQYFLTAFVWWMFMSVGSAFLEGAAVRRDHPPAAPQSAIAAFDLGMLAMMFMAGWYMTAFAYAMTCGLLALIKGRRRPSRL